MANIENKNNNSIILNLSQQTIITNAIVPLAAAVCCKILSMLSGIVTAFQILANPPQNHRSIIPNVIKLRLMAKQGDSKRMSTSETVCSFS